MRRTPAVYVPPEPSTSATPAALPIEPQKGRKGLPFLKNPMSTLLMRRKTNQNAPDVLPLPLPTQPEPPTYDPRIKGTRVHDFSAPRNRGTSAHSASRNTLAADADDRARHSIERNSRFGRSAGNSVRSAASHSLGKTPSASSTKTVEFRDNNDDMSPVMVANESTPEVIPEVIPEEGQATESIAKPMGSTRTTRSRNVSLSSIPKHMKSTSSRFSFDMIGAAKQEKIMEERHRQRAQERQDADGPDRPDSRYDEFDDDDFDYDAMMDDDGLEERIPGVNADYDEEEDPYLEEEPYMEEDPYVKDDQYGEEMGSADNHLHPDNDQENFAGFVFQRSNPGSSLASPQINTDVSTPRDAEGMVIGSAITKDTPTTRAFPLSPEPPISPDPKLTQQFSGLGISDAQSPQYQNFTRTKSGRALQTVNEDDLYYDDGGITGYEDDFAEDLAAEPEWDATPFDESIFDMNDTDQFGRPIPGAFAQAQSQRRALQEKELPTKRESDMTSGFSAQSGTTQSTAHTSLSVDVGAGHGLDRKRSAAGAPQGDNDNAQLEQPAADYQAALAAAAHKAAASGKFQRTASPTLENYEDAASTDDHTEVPVDDDVYDDDYEFGYENMDDFELDDEAIIAEANASALAHDSDGWYGSEFGFYAAPKNQNHPAYGSSAESSVSEFGGFFGPKGMSDLARSASGRLISREPNLTPITERSEYSNRNSLMSMGLPALQSGTPTTLQSPGLAQLAMMADAGDEQMTLSALLKLRSKAWGGSQASQSSSREGSPQSERGDLANSPWIAAGQGHVRQNSALSGASRDSDSCSAPGSPTVTMSTPAMPPPPIPQQRNYGSPLRGNSAPAAYRPNPQPPFQYAGEVTESAPVSAVSERLPNDFPWTQPGYVGQDAMPRPSRSAGARSHHRHNSSADSISYMLEGEDTAQPRWVMERRRTGESGQVEILEREVVEGGRI